MALRCGYLLIGALMVQTVLLQMISGEEPVPEGEGDTLLTCPHCGDLESAPHPHWALPPDREPVVEPTTEGLLTDDDQSEITEIFSNPQCIVRKMQSVWIEPKKWEGRWWAQALLNVGPVTALLLDFYDQKDDKGNLILREVAADGEACRAQYSTVQDITYSDGTHGYQKTYNYSLSTTVLQPGRTQSLFFKILWDFDNVVVLYSCAKQNADGNCAAGNGSLYVLSRVRKPLLDSEIQLLQSIVSYVCLEGTLTRIDNSEDALTGCINDYVGLTALYKVPEFCDYSDTQWLISHSLPETYGNLIDCDAWVSLSGKGFASVANLLYDDATSKLTVYRYKVHDDRCSMDTPSPAYAVNDTSFNLWYNDFPDPKGNSQAQFWRNAADEIWASTYGCFLKPGEVCVNSTQPSMTILSRRYRKLTVLEMRVKIFPLLAAACVDPTKINVPNDTHGDCGAALDNKTCLISDLPKLQLQTFDLTKIVGSSWVLHQVMSEYPYQSVRCSAEAGDSITSISFTCYIKSFDECDGPLTFTFTASNPPGTFLLTDFPIYISSHLFANQQVAILYQSDTAFVWYSCAINGENPDGTCRTDRTNVAVFVKNGASISTEEEAEVSKVLDSVCVWARTEVQTLSADSDCGSS